MSKKPNTQALQRTPAGGDVRASDRAKFTPARGLRRHEKDETPALRDLADEMNRLHAQMGGRDSRPERKALLKCMRLIEKAIEDARAGK